MPSIRASWPMGVGVSAALRPAGFGGAVTIPTMSTEEIPASRCRASTPKPPLPMNTVRVRPRRTESIFGAIGAVTWWPA